MSSPAPSYQGYRFPPEIISHGVWLYHRFSLSFRDAEDLLAQRGITVSYETPPSAPRAGVRRMGYGDVRLLNERETPTSRERTAQFAPS